MQRTGTDLRKFTVEEYKGPGDSWNVKTKR